MLRKQHTRTAMERLQITGMHLICSDSRRIDPNLAEGLADYSPGGPFRYTLNNSALTDEQRQFYEKNGFLVIKNVVPKENLQKYGQRFRQICNGEVTLPYAMTVMKDVAIAKTGAKQGENTVTKIQTFVDDEELFEYCCLPEVLKYVKCFTGENIMAMHTMLINKPPDPGTKSSRHPIHQDLHFFPFRPADRIVCAWTAMEKVTRANGCLVVIPGTHRGELMEHEYPDWEGGVNKLYHGVKGWHPDKERVWVEMEEGDTVFFHPVLLHGSGANITQGYRKAISCHYAASECHFCDIRGSTQEHAAQELQEMVSKKTGFKGISAEDVWRASARCVSGKIINI